MQKSVTDWFNNFADSYDRIHYKPSSTMEYVEKKRQSMVFKAGTFYNKEIIDIACGTGFYLNNYGKFNNVWGCDISSSMIEVCKKKGFCNLIVSDFQFIPFKSNYFDILLNIGSFAYAESGEQCISEMSRVLKDGGTLIMTYFCKTNWRNIRYLKRFAKPGSPPHFEKRYRWETISYLLSKYDFHIKKRFSLNFLPFRINAKKRNRFVLSCISLIETYLNTKLFFFCNEIVVFAHKSAEKAQSNC